MATGVLTEHEPREKEDVTREYEPSKSERRIIKIVEKELERLKAYREPYTTKWTDYYRMFRGWQWKDIRPGYRHMECINFIFQAIQSQVPILTDSRPRVEYLAKEPSDREFAKIMNEMFESDFVSGKWLAQLTELIYDGEIYGTGHGHIYHDPDSDLGLGRLKFESADPFNIFPDSTSRDVNVNTDIFIHAEPFELEKLKRKYPEKAEFLKADLDDFLTEQNKFGDQEYLYSRPASEYQPRPQDSGNITINRARNQVLLITAYFKDPEIVEEKKKMKDSKGKNKEVFEQRKKYPFGRKIVMASKVILEDSAMITDQIPYQRFSNYILPREYWGISEVEQLESPQKIFNKLVSFTLDVLTLMGNPVWIVDDTADVDPENLVNRPGLVIEKSEKGNVRREEGVQLQPFVMQLIDRMERWFNEIAGTQDVSRGATPGSVTAASAIITLQEAAQTRLRQKSRNLDDLLQDLGQQYLTLALQHYDTPRVFRITNDENASTYFKAHVQEDEGELYLVVEREGELPQSIPIKNRLDVTVTTGTMLPFARAQLEQRLLHYFDRQIIDAEELLKKTEYPNYEAVLERQQQRQAAMAQQQV